MEEQQTQQERYPDISSLYAFDDEQDLMPQQPNKKRNQWIAIASGIVILSLLIGAIFIAKGRKQTTPTTYQFATARQGNIILSVSATGPVQSGLYNLSFNGTGKISEIDVSVGQQVKQGQVLAKLDPTSLQDALNQAKNSLTSAQIGYNNSLISLQNTQNQGQANLNSAYDQEQNALHTCTTESNPPPNCTQAAQDQYAATQAQVNAQNASAQAQVNSTQAQLQSAQTQVQTAEDTIGNTTLTAPHDGVVATVNGIVGENASSGSTAFIQIIDLSSLQVMASINEADVGNVADGQSVTFTTDAYPNITFTGTVSAISPLGQTSSNVVTYAATINVDTTNLHGKKLYPGMTATTTIITAERQNVMEVPNTALTFAIQAANPNGLHLITRTAAIQALQQARALLQKLSAQTTAPVPSTDTLRAGLALERVNGSWVTIPVVVGLSDGTNTEVVAGLKQGDSIAISQNGKTTTSTTFQRGGSGGNGNFGGNRFGNPLGGGQ